ncbi:chitinase [Paenibacillus melissococcoides]|uniref:Chitinase n=1 Tax=Paenibacillus melissococcoides TaxID=2912268 RepID=A0ABN8U5P5_9BACL|nr:MULTISPECIES: glycoside hydrolase family 19 protein [Paenibacillus]MEB9895630.1 glycoside hydrolase family 19 protein [Bacillus cereus]CAH8246384.1 chitinase [Paenibacillus melissococcoides]CAH8714583.1 chitinase [Paenibacillus melissococcoides]CAH8715539.1 chitinase [Paenibacillus melissococcoides]GIO78165.1 chitinase [Paenibacillus dendritiformis]
MKRNVLKPIVVMLVMMIGTVLIFPFTAFGALSPPTLQVSASNATCTLSWNSIPGATGYDIYRNGSWYRWTNALSAADTGLTNGTTYTYAVAAQNDTTTPVTTSPQSASKTCTPTGSGIGGGFVVTEAQFNQMFPDRNPFYTYSGFVSALSAYPAFANTGSDTIKKQEAAAFLGNVAQESGHLRYIVELDTSTYPFYCDNSSVLYPCAPGKQYYGRGPLQLSWNFNYGAAGAALGLPLLTNPDLVAQDSSVAWKTALWFWNTQSGAGTMTPHNAMVNGAGFGETIRSINGVKECNGANPGAVNNRISFYTIFANLLGVPTGGNLGC